jgi:integrase
MTSYSVQKHNGSWQMRWSKYVNGKRTQPVHTLGPDTMKKADANTMAAEYMARVSGSNTVEADATVEEFVTGIFFPDCETNLAEGTLKIYRQQWKRLKPHLGAMKLRDVMCKHIQAALDAVKAKRGDELCHAMYLHCQTTCKVIWGLAIRQGHYSGENPERETKVRNYGHNKKRENGAHDLNAIKQYMTAFADDDDRDIQATIAINAFLALRAPEAESLQPEDYDPIRNLVHVHLSTKTHNDEWLPVVAPLREIMKRGWNQINMRRAEKAIRKRLKGTTLRWKGWYAFRRGMCSNLYHLGVPPEEACLMLRNTAEVCRKHYLRLDQAKSKAKSVAAYDAAYEAQPVVPVTAIQ